MQEKEKKYALITGSTKGIGKANVLLFLENGYEVIANYAHDDTAAEKLLSELPEYKDHLYIIKSELSSYVNAVSFVQKVKKITDKIHVAVFNCGATDRTPFPGITEESWEYVFNTNLNVPVYILQEMYDIIQEDGSILFIGSVMGIYTHAASLAYNVSKAAVHALAKSLVKIFADRRITVNAIAPGFTDTPWQNGKTKEHRESIENKTAAGRFANAEEIASLCYFVAHNKYINGAVYEISGGYLYK